MKVIVAGTRQGLTHDDVKQAIKASGFNVTEVVSGCAKGVDQMAIRWAKARNVPVRTFPADWPRYGKSAGPIRNQQMAKYAEALVAVWDGDSKGTANMIAQAKQNGLRVFVYMATRRTARA